MLEIDTMPSLISTPPRAMLTPNRTPYPAFFLTLGAKFRSSPRFFFISSLNRAISPSTPPNLVSSLRGFSHLHANMDTITLALGLFFILLTLAVVVVALIDVFVFVWSKDEVSVNE